MTIETSRFWRVGHRGAPGQYPPNTLKGFRQGLELGCNMVECDIRRTSDGELALAHDETVTDHNGGKWVVSEHTLAELQALDLGAGEGVPSLQELVALLAAGSGAIMADMKCAGDGVEEKVVQELAPLPLERILIPGAERESRDRFRQINPGLPLSLSLNPENAPMPTVEAFEHILAGIDTRYVTWHYLLLNPARVQRLHSRGIRVFAWTVDTLERMQELRSWSVDGIISNHPEWLVQI